MIDLRRLFNLKSAGVAPLSVHLQYTSSGNLQPVIKVKSGDQVKVETITRPIGARGLDIAVAWCAFTANFFGLEPWTWFSDQDYRRCLSDHKDLSNKTLSVRRGWLMDELAIEDQERRTWLTQYDCLSNEYLNQLTDLENELAQIQTKLELLSEKVFEETLSAGLAALIESLAFHSRPDRLGIYESKISQGLADIGSLLSEDRDVNQSLKALIDSIEASEMSRAICDHRQEIELELEITEYFAQHLAQGD